MEALAAAPLGSRTRPAGLSRAEGKKVRCLACGHRCLLSEGGEGICRVRFVRDGVLRAPWGYVASLALDPVEKKPFFHFLPGSLALSFGMYGCDLRCPFCQNWEISQLEPGGEALPSGSPRPRDISPGEIAEEGLRTGAAAVVSTYNEPLVTAEWASDVFRAARERGLSTAIVSNGHGTPEVVAHLSPVVDAVKIDLKGMRDETYRALGGRLGAVLETLAAVHRSGAWLEVVTLVVPGLNDTDEELRAAARFLASLSPDVPWHVTAFHPDYRMTERARTPTGSLERACRIGQEEGLRFVYAGNVAARTASESTRCPGCGEVVVERHGFRVVRMGLDGKGRCPRCGLLLPGRWRSSLTGPSLSS